MSSATIEQLAYHPQVSPGLDLEVFTMTDLRLRGRQEKIQTTHRYGFYTLIGITQGSCTQMVDFRPLHRTVGTLLILQPGQAHNFGPDQHWDGWIVLFRPEFISSTSDDTSSDQVTIDLLRLPECLSFNQDEFQVLISSIQQMHKDTHIKTQPSNIHILLRHQIYALLARLSIRNQQHTERMISPALQRFKRFQTLVEQRFTQWHQVSSYTRYLGYTEKSLARAVLAAAGVSIKSFIMARVNLEAKRLLVHTDLSIASIAEHLGFDEATHFSKFFKRESGCSPGKFRKRHNLS